MAIEIIRIGLRLDSELHKAQVTALKILPYGGKSLWVMTGVEYALDRGFAIEPELCRGLKDTELDGRKGRSELFQVSLRITQEQHPGVFSILSELPVGSGSPWIREALLFAATQGYEGPNRRPRRKLYRSASIEPKEVAELKTQVHKLEGIVYALTSGQMTLRPAEPPSHVGPPEHVKPNNTEPATEPQTTAESAVSTAEPVSVDPARAVVASIPVSDIEDVIDHDRQYITELKNRRMLEEQMAQFGD